MKRQQRTVGAVIEIPLPNGYYAYGRILKEGDFAFYDFVSEVESVDYTKVLQSKVLFIRAVFNDVITQGRWLKVYKASVEPALDDLPNKYIEDALLPGNYSIYNTNTGEITPATKAECDGLEVAAVWQPWQIEEQLMDYLFPNLPVAERKVVRPSSV